MPTLIPISAFVTMPGLRVVLRCTLLDDPRRALRLARVVGAADPDRREDHAVGADPAPALRARDTRLAVRVPVAPEQLGHRRTSVARVRVHVAFTPDEAAAAPTGIVVDVLRATSTIAQALAAGYERVLCVPEIEEARALRASSRTASSAASGTRSGSTASTSAPRRASSSSRAPGR